ncbi:MAG: hypothetical protein JWO30_2893 [Fibrobacteres bacterium]|nr:hypothetical protein [Fibrobacterota bacterium]
MKKRSVSIRDIVFAGLSVMTLALFTACINDETGAPGGGGEIGKPDVSFQIKHMHFAQASMDFQLVDDLPAKVKIELAGIPGDFFGSPSEDSLFNLLVASGSSFRIPWEGLANFPSTTQPAPYTPERKFFDAVSPASVKIMRIGTFAEAESGGPVLGSEAGEGYGFFDPTLKVFAVLVYFSGAATLSADYALCDSSRFSADVRIPAAGFYFLYQKIEGKKVTVALLPSVSSLQYGVMSFAPAFLDYQSAQMEAQHGCESGLGKRAAFFGFPSR